MNISELNQVIKNHEDFLQQLQDELSPTMSTEHKLRVQAIISSTLRIIASLAYKKLKYEQERNITTFG